MKPVSTAIAVPRGATSTVRLCPPSRASASYSVTRWRFASSQAAPRLTVVTAQRGRGAMPTSEELSELMRAVASDGDRQAFAVLFKHFAPRVTAYLVRAGTPSASAEELAQETMVLIWRKAASFDP